jgi:hypothetical protein
MWTNKIKLTDGKRSKKEKKAEDKVKDDKKRKEDNMKVENDEPVRFDRL